MENFALVSLIRSSSFLLSHFAHFTFSCYELFLLSHRIFFSFYFFALLFDFYSFYLQKKRKKEENTHRKQHYVEEGANRIEYLRPSYRKKKIEEQICKFNSFSDFYLDYMFVRTIDHTCVHTYSVISILIHLKRRNQNVKSRDELITLQNVCHQCASIMICQRQTLFTRPNGVTDVRFYFRFKMICCFWV